MKKSNNLSDSNLSDTQVERSLIMTLLAADNGTGHAKALRAYLLEDDFTDETHRAAWKAIVKVLDDHNEVNMVNVFTKAKSIGISFDMSRYVMINNNFFSDPQQQGWLLHELGQKRRMSDKLLDVMMSLQSAEYSSVSAVSEIDGILEEISQSAGLDFSAWSAVHNDILHLTEDKANGKVPKGVMTGIRLIDRKGGLEPGELMVIGGRNSNGKTSFALGLALSAALQGVPVCIFSLEMTNRMLGIRLQSLLSGVDGESIKRAELTKEEWVSFTRTPTELPLYFDNRRSTDINVILTSITAIVEQRRVRVVVVDYLQIIKSKERDRAQQVANISHELQALSTKLEITIILLSQLRRNQGTDYCPKLEELKESGDIADAADSIYFIYRPERHSVDAKYPDMSERWSEYSTRGTALLICCKNRLGAMDAEELLRFDARTTRFYEDIEIEKNEFEAAPSTEFTINDVPF